MVPVLLVVFDHELPCVRVVVWHIRRYVRANCVSLTGLYFVFHMLVRADGPNVLRLVPLVEVTARHRDSAYSCYAIELDIRGAVVLQPLLVLQALLAA